MLMTHSDLVVRAKRWLLNRQKCAFVFTELATNGYQIPDALGFRSRGESILVECKVSRADFMGDRRKRERYAYRDRLGQFRFYMVPEGLIAPEEVPDVWGLLYVNDRRIKIVKPCQVCYGNVVSQHYERLMLISALRRVHLRGDLDKIKDYNTIGSGRE